MSKVVAKKTAQQTAQPNQAARSLSVPWAVPGTGNWSTTAMHHGPPVPAVKPTDPDLENFFSLDYFKEHRDEEIRKKLEPLRKDILTTDLTWKQVLRIDNKDVTIELASEMCRVCGYFYFCLNNKIYLVDLLRVGEATEIQGIAEKDINEVL